MRLCRHDLQLAAQYSGQIPRKRFSNGWQRRIPDEVKARVVTALLAGDLTHKEIAKQNDVSVKRVSDFSRKLKEDSGWRPRKREYPELDDYICRSNKSRGWLKRISREHAIPYQVVRRRAIKIGEYVEAAKD